MMREMSGVHEETVESSRRYADPFAEVDVDAVYTGESGEWRVPAFWRGDARWTVRFRPPAPGRFRVRIESTVDDPDLNRDLGEVSIGSYEGDSELLRRGPLRVAANGRHFEHADGTPFSWLGDTWWTGLSSRLPWEGFVELARDRAALGYTLVQICGGLVPHDELPTGSGFANEGGPSWEADLGRINPGYFDAAERRIAHLVESGLVPAIVGGWRGVIEQLGVTGLRRHWRNLVARWGSYPVVWIVGGELFDPPTEAFERVGISPDGVPMFGQLYAGLRAEGWTDVLRYLRQIDPYQHPTTAHEVDPPYDWPVQDESLLDFDLFQAGHRGRGSLATAIALTGAHYARTAVTKPVVIGEIAYEGISGENHADVQRFAYWTTLLNGAAGFTYGTLPLAVAYPETDAADPFRFTAPDPMAFQSWREAAALPGAGQVALAARFLRGFPWHELAPHPEWTRPAGTTMLQPRVATRGFDIDLIRALADEPGAVRTNLPAGYWRDADGDARLPYAAGIPGWLRLLYLPGSGEFLPTRPPTVLGLEPGIPYEARYWDPITGSTIPLGPVRRPDDAATVFTRASGTGPVEIEPMGDLRVTLDAAAHIDAELSVRASEEGDRIVARYHATEAVLEILEVVEGVEGRALDRVPVPTGVRVRLTLEVRGPVAIASAVLGEAVASSEIVDVRIVAPGGVATSNGALEVRRLGTAPVASTGEIRVRDLDGRERGILAGASWEAYRATAVHAFDAYRPPRVPVPQDWVLVLERSETEPQMSIDSPGASGE
jgi:hypothetical protein